jgi:hypothetical protein
MRLLYSKDNYKAEGLGFEIPKDLLPFAAAGIKNFTVGARPKTGEPMTKVMGPTKIYLQLHNV